MRTHKFERSIIEGKVKYNARSMDRPDDDDIIYTAKEEHFGDRDDILDHIQKISELSLHIIIITM